MEKSVHLLKHMNRMGAAGITGTELDGEVSAALSAMDIAQNMMAEAEGRFEFAKEELRQSARRYLMGADGETDQRKRASYVYWHMPLVPVGIIAEILLGNPRSVQKTLALLEANGTDIECTACMCTIFVKSRSELAERRKWATVNANGEDLCDACKAERQSQIHAQWAADQVRQTERELALRTMPYRDYLLTEEWFETRTKKLRRAGYRCQLCNAGGLLNVHHRTYERRGFEYDTDLIVLCHPCHAKFHGKMP